METNKGGNQAEQTDQAERSDVLETAFADAVAALSRLREVLRERAPFLEELELRLNPEWEPGRRATLYGRSIYWTTSAYGYGSVREFARECEKKPVDRALALAELKKKELDTFKSLELWRKRVSELEALMVKPSVIADAAGATAGGRGLTARNAENSKNFFYVADDFD